MHGRLHLPGRANICMHNAESAEQNRVAEIEMSQPSQDKARCVNLMREGTMGRNPRGPLGAVRGGFVDLDGKWDDEKTI